MTPQQEAVNSAREILGSITTSKAPAGHAVERLLEAANVILSAVERRFQYDYGDEILDGTAVYRIINLVKQSELYMDGLVPSGLTEKDSKTVLFDLRGLGIRTATLDGFLWVEDWVRVAHNKYNRDGGFAGLTFRKFITKLRPSVDSQPTKGKGQAKQRLNTDDMVDDEELYNVKRKVRDKAPRLKARMGHGRI